MPTGGQHGDALPSNDDALGHELSRALHRRASGPVDVEALIEGSHRRARQLRTRRVGLGTAGVVLVLALPVGIEVLNNRPDASATAAMSAGTPTTSWTVSGTPAPDQPTGIGPPASATVSVPGRSAGISAPSSSLVPPVAYAIPDSLAFDAADIPGLTLASDAGQVPGLPAVHGQVCRTTAAAGDVTSIAGREWTWTDGSGSATGMTVTLTITGWNPGEGRTAFSELVANTGRCAFTVPQTDNSGELNSGIEGWMGTSTVGDLSYGRAVVRFGDMLGGIEVQDARGKSAATNDVQKLVQAVVQQLNSHPTPTPTAVPTT